MLIFFVFRSRSKTTHIASFIFSDSCFSAAKILKLSLLALTVASLDNKTFFACAQQLSTFVFIV